MRILITGCDGFLGRHLSAYFGTNPDNSVTGLLRKEDVIEGCSKVALSDYGPSLEDQLLDMAPDIIIHAAGTADPTWSITDPQGDFSANTVLLHRLMTCLGKLNLHPKFINLSSAAIYGNPVRLPMDERQIPKPLSPYGLHKLMGEQICLHLSRLYNVPSASLRIFSAYGPFLQKQVIWSIMAKMTTEKEILLHGTGLESRDFIYAEDVCQAVSKVIENAPCEGEAYNVANGMQITIADLARCIAEKIDFTGKIDFEGKAEHGKPINWCADINAIRALGYTPKWMLEQGLISTSAWFNKQRDFSPYPSNL